MDALSTSAALLSLLLLINDSVQVARSLRKALINDNRFRITYFRLIGEKRKYEAWANNMRLVGSQIGADDLADVKEIKMQLEATLAKASQKLKMYRPRLTEKSIVDTFGNRVKWHIGGGVEEVTELLELIRTLNETLGLIAPILPPYSSAGAAAGQSPGLTPTATADAEFDEEDESRQTGEPLTSLPTMNTLRDLFNVCCTGLSTIGLHKTKKQQIAREQIYRFRLWGFGLFDHTMSLEELLPPSVDRASPLRTFLLDALVDIAIAEEKILQRWVSESSLPNQNALRGARLQITALLGTDEVAQLTMEKWQVILEEESETGEYTDEQDVDTIKNTIEILFDMLPTIRSTRREYVLRQEALEQRKMRRAEEEVSQTATQAVSSARALVVKNREQIEVIENAIRDQELAARAQGRKIQLYSKKIEKTRMRLEEWDRDVVDDHRAASRVWESSEVEKVQVELSKELSRFIKENSSQLRGGLKDDQRTTSSLEKADLKPEMLEMNAADMEKLANRFDLAVSHLLATSGL